MSETLGHRPEPFTTLQTLLDLGVRRRNILRSGRYEGGLIVLGYEAERLIEAGAPHLCDRMTRYGGSLLIVPPGQVPK